MSLSKRAKRGIGTFNKINEAPSRWKYKAKRMMIEAAKPKLAANILEAAQAAMEALPEEIRNAHVPELSVQQDDAKPENPEGGEKHDVPVQREDSQETPEGKETGPAGGPQC